jgi:hypothetical protein
MMRWRGGAEYITSFNMCVYINIYSYNIYMHVYTHICVLARRHTATTMRLSATVSV